MSTMTDTKGRRTRRSFTDDYKTGAVRLVLDEGKTVASAARDLGLTESSLRNCWRPWILTNTSSRCQVSPIQPRRRRSCRA